MLPFNAEFQTGESRITQVRLSVLLASGVLLNMTEEHVILSGFTRDSSTTVDGQFTVGAAVTGKLNVVIDNTDKAYSSYDFRAAVITASLGGQLFDGTYQLVQVGIYTVDDYVYNGSNITLTAYDNLKKFDLPCKDNGSQPTYPTTLAQMVNLACSAAGVTLANVSIPNGTYSITQAPEAWDTMTWHDVIAYCAQIACCWAKVLPNGNLFLAWYDTSPFNGSQLDGGTFNTDTTPYSDGAVADGGDFTYGTTTSYDGGSFGDRDNAHYLGSLYDLSIDTDDVQITGVIVTLDPSNNIDATDDTDTYTKKLGTDGYIITIENNPLIETTADADAVAAYLYDIIAGVRFRPLNASIVENPSVEAGDVALVIDREDNTYTCFLSHVTYTTNAPTSISCDAAKTTQNLKARYGEAEKTRALTQRVYNKAMSNAEEAMFTITTAIATTMGLYPYLVSDGQGGTIYIFGNKDSLAASDIQWKFTAGALMVSNDYGATWNGAITSAGQAILQEVYAVKVNADNIITGVFSVSKNGTEIFHADTDTGIVRISGDAEFSGELNAATGNFNGKLVATRTYVQPGINYTDTITIADTDNFYPISITRENSRYYSVYSSQELEFHGEEYIQALSGYGRRLHKIGPVSWNVFAEVSDFIGVFSRTNKGDASHIRLESNPYGQPLDITYYEIWYNGPRSSSDRRLKKDITDLDPDIAKHIRPVSFRFKTEPKKRYGFIAQEVQEIMPDAVVEDDNGYLSLNYEQMIAPLYALVQEQQTRIDKLENRIERLEALIKQIAPKEV